jgi:hypothetical protein
LTKACARHGLGLYIYAGEDLPEEEQPTAQPKNDIDILKLIAEVNACTKSADVTKMWNAHPELKTNEAFKAAVAARGKELKAKEGAA